MKKMVWNEVRTCGLFNQKLRINQACFEIISDLDEPLRFYARNTDCYECDFFPKGISIRPKETTSYIIDTSYGFESYFSNGKNILCNMTNHFEDFGVYSMNVSQNACSDVEVLKEPEKFWFNFSLLICLYLGAVGLFVLLRFIYVWCHSYTTSSFTIFSFYHFIFYRILSSMTLRELETDLGSPDSRDERANRSPRQSRITSIDAFRGFAIVVMIFVNYNGGDYQVFKHTPWNGLGIADLVFPWFVWIMGASIALSLRSNLRTYRSKRKIFEKILKRTILLVALGIVLNSGHREKNFLRICGVLQRLGVTYFAVASIEILFAKPQTNEQLRWWHHLLGCMQWPFAIAFAIVHTLLTFLLPVPGCPTGYLGPGGFSDHSGHRNCTGGAAGYIDRLVLTENHMYHRGSFVKVYDPPVAYDPEGLLGTLTSMLCAFFGLQAARIILNVEDSYSRIWKWLIWAVFTGISAGFLCGWSQNDGFIPINKNLWSLSYVLACASTAFLIQSIFYWLIDFTQIWSGFPFVSPGLNAITLYLGHSLLKNQLPWRWIPLTNTHFEILLMDVTATMIWLLVSHVLHRRNIFITL